MELYPQNSETQTHFIKDWLNYFNLEYESDFSYQGVLIDYFLSGIKLAIIDPKWKRPLTVAYLHKLIEVIETLKLTKVFVLSENLSATLEDTIERYKFPIEFISPTSLSSVAIYLGNHIKISRF